ncbi:MAG: penicillin-binding protein 2 [Flavobacteriales bacterium]|nr:penicillin-binding protein 2 [Flavobacteriales bacterium]|tara:strand:+ start:19346 stop:21169 length:1824 start_codon:yes stop_codon:yes gene_type:complete
MAKLESRKYHIALLFGFFFVIYLSRLFYVQVIANDFFTNRAKTDAVDKVVEFPVRGNIYDRNGIVLVQNEIAYDVMITLRDFEADTLRFCKLLGIDTVEFNHRLGSIKQNRGYSSRVPQVFESLMKSEDFGGIKERLFNYKGISVKKRTVRNYPKAIAAHVLGHVSKVGPRDLKKDAFYIPQDYKGSSGLEQFYEQVLRGKKGWKHYLKNRHGKHISSYLEGALDTFPKPGNNLKTTLDADLQEYGERLMRGKIGAIVALEPSTGEVLAMVNAPTYDPNLLVGGKYGKNYQSLAKDEKKILFPRAIQSRQPPGSIVKTLQSAIALDIGVANEYTSYRCNTNLVGCHNHSSPLTLPQAIQHSCNPYYYHLVNKIFNKGRKGNMAQMRKGMDEWEKYVRSFGFGDPLGIDLHGEKDGNVPDKREYDKIYGRNHWNWSTIYSIAIGQGEFSVTPIQMANLAASIANKGYYFRPHLVTAVGEQKINFENDSSYRNQTLVDSTRFDIVQKGMQWVLEESGGTALRSRLDSITICGKTGTSQNPHGDDHSVFMAFAPRKNPEIAIAVFVENAGGGGGTAAPIASLMIEQYLKGDVERVELEKEMIDKVFYKVE